MVALYLVFLVFLQIAYCSGPPSRRLPCGSELTSHRNWRLLDTSNICGISGSSAESRILGGRKAKEGEFPWMAMLVLVNKYGKKKFDCGGGIINDRYILTAAHCLHRRLRYVQVGGMNSYNFSKCYGENCHAKIFKIERKIPHKHYDDHTLHNDIALIRLKEKIQFDDFKRPICLPTSCKLINKNFKGTELLLAGWGLSDQNGKLLEDGPLRTVEIVATSREVCSKRWKSYILHSQICFLGTKRGGGVRGGASGDSGSPIVYRNFSAKGLARHFAIGVVSNGPDTDPDNSDDQAWEEDYRWFPAVDTRVAAYMPWILRTIQP